MKWPGTYVAYAVIMAVFGETAAGIHLGLLFARRGRTRARRAKCAGCLAATGLARSRRSLDAGVDGQRAGGRRRI